MMKATRARLISALSCCALALFVPTSVGQTTRPSTQPDRTPATQPATQPDVVPGVSPSLPSLTGPDALVRRVEDAHGGRAWDRKTAVQGDLAVTFGGNEMLSGTLLYEKSSGQVRIELPDEVTLVFDGERAWVSPSSAKVPMARFHLLTWPYFLAAPFKLDDPGTSLERHRLLSFNDKLCETAKLTFGAGVGDAPDDWYIIYADPLSHRLLAMAYIVTYAKSVADAEQEAHAIVYHDYQRVDGVLLSTRWTFHNWNDQQGIHGEPIGEARLANLQFVTPSEESFEKPEDAKEDPLPDR